MAAIGDVEKSPQPSVKQTETVESEFTFQEQKSIIKRIDLRVTVVCGVIYLISLLDRGNLGFANING